MTDASDGQHGPGRWLVLAIVLVLLAGAVVLGRQTAPTPPVVTVPAPHPKLGHVGPEPPGIPAQIPLRASGVPSACPGSLTNSGWSPDPAATIAALGHGGVFNGTGKCYLTDGIVIAHNDVTVDGGTYYDPLDSAGSTFAPIFDIENQDSDGHGDASFTGHNVTIENVDVVGANTAHVEKNVLESGIETKGTAGDTLINDRTANTFGDGLEVWVPVDLPNATNPGSAFIPTTSLTVSELTISNAGRDGVTLAAVQGALFTDLGIYSSGPDAISTESDENDVSAGGVTVNNCIVQTTTTDVLNIAEAPTAPGIAFTGCSFQTGPYIINSGPTGSQACTTAPSTVAACPVTFAASSFVLPDETNGTPPASLGIEGLDVTVTHCTFTRAAQNIPITSPMWSATSGATLLFQDGSTLAKPLGTRDEASTVTIDP